MGTEKNHRQRYLDVLQEELIPAMGCTEPIALAYAAAKARSLLGQVPTAVAVQASGSIIKNVKSVVVPNTRGLRGIGVAAAAGIVAGREDLELQVLSQITAEQIEEIHGFLKQTPIAVSPMLDCRLFDILVSVSAGAHSAAVRICDSHTNVVYLEQDGQAVLDTTADAGEETGPDRSFLTMEGIWNFVQTAALADLEPLLTPQMTHNWAIAGEGLRGGYGANVGQTILFLYGGGLTGQACAMAAAASDARMNGCELPVVINSGSGNQGITASVPVLAAAKQLHSSHEQTLRALALSNLIAIHEKTGVGRLSAYCGAVCAGAGAGAGIAYLHGGTFDTICATVTNALAVVSGMVCDGAKASCAAKIAVAVQAGIFGYQMTQVGQTFHGGDGIVGGDVEETIYNVGLLAREGMAQTNQKIIGIMTDAHK